MDDLTVLIVGSGGREHALCRSLAAVAGVSVLTAPGNPGAATVARLLPIAADDVGGVVAAARSEGVHLVVPGPEVPLVAGLADALDAAGIPCCGPSAAAAQLEGSKAFTRTLAAEAGVPGPGYRIVSPGDDIDAALAAFATPPVVKADGLAAGKGVTLPETMDEARAEVDALLGGRLGDAGRVVVLEERLAGTEASFFYACRGTTAVALPHARDHKRLGDGDRGPNTGGMGAISPNPIVGATLEAEVADTIVVPTLTAMARNGTPFHGFLYAGVMLTDDGPMLLEYNVRLGDPEAQAIIPRLDPSALFEVCRWVAGLRRDPPDLRVDPRPTCVVVVAAEGYPEAPRRGDSITIDPAIETRNRWFIHAGTAIDDGGLVTAGGRVGAVVARGETGDAARRRAYEGVDLVTFPGMTYRTDIGATP
jgi:phosphoribosylamine--glycine ligase